MQSGYHIVIWIDDWEEGIGIRLTSPKAQHGLSHEDPGASEDLAAAGALVDQARTLAQAVEAFLRELRGPVPPDSLQFFDSPISHVSIEAWMQNPVLEIVLQTGGIISIDHEAGDTFNLVTVGVGSSPDLAHSGDASRGRVA